MALQCVAADSHLTNAVNAAKFNLVQSATPGASAPFSINVWIRANWGTDTAVVGRRSFVGTYGPAPTPTTALQIGASAGAGDLTCWTWGGNLVLNSGGGFMNAFNNVWVNVCYTYDSTTHRLYLNATPVTTSTTPQLGGPLQMVYIDGYPGGVLSEVADHQVDSYSLYTRTLSQDEITTIYNARGSRHGIINGQLATYEFDEGGDGTNCTTCLDLTGNGLHLLFEGAAATPTYTYAATVAGSNIRPGITL